jgi:hypothetical protein
MPKKDKKKPTCVHKSVSCLLVFLKGVIIQKTFYTLVFSSIVAKVSTLAFSGISESFFATAAKEAPEEIPTNIPSSLAALRVKSYASSLLTCMAPSRSLYIN